MEAEKVFSLKCVTYSKSNLRVGKSRVTVS